MNQSPFRSSFLVFITVVSFFGLFLTVILASNPPTMQDTLHWRKPIIGVLFELICALGIIAVFFPKRCSAIFHPTKGERDTHPNQEKIAAHGDHPTLRGHHPTCGNFSAHTIRICDKIFCAACTGLLLGALMALAGVALYFFSYWRIGQNSSLTVSV